MPTISKRCSAAGVRAGPSVPRPQSWEAAGIQPKPIFPLFCFPGLEMLFSRKRRKKKKGKCGTGEIFTKTAFLTRKNKRQQELLEPPGCLCRENWWWGVFKAGFFQHCLRRRKKKTTQQYFWTSLALFSPWKHFPASPPSTIPIAPASLVLWRFIAMLPHRERWEPASSVHYAPVLGDLSTGTHQDVGDQPVPPEALPGVGSAGRVGVHQHQHVLLALQERRRRAMGGCVEPELAPVAGE